MDAKMASDLPASTGLGIHDMARSVLFFFFIFLISVSLALLYIFDFSRLFIAVLCLTTLLIVYLLFHPRNQWLVANRSRVDGERCVALTFDDGPDPVYTPKLLDLLREKGVKATFFVIGKRADQYPEIVRRAWSEGHLVGNHTWSHYPLFCFLMPRRLQSEIERGTREHSPQLWFHSALFPLARGSASPAAGAVSGECGSRVHFLEHSDPRYLQYGFRCSCPAHSE